MTTNLYVRLMPYNPQAGACCRRYTVGSRTFESERWYEMPEEWARNLGELRQSSGVAFFQVMTPEQYADISRAELAAAYMRAGQMMTSASIPEASPTPKGGPVRGVFDGMPQVREIDPRSIGIPSTKRAAPPPPPEAAPLAEPAEGDDVGPDLDAMSKTQLLLTAKEYGVAGVDERMTKGAIKSALDSAIYGGDDE
jgi:hypothetical protein